MTKEQFFALPSAIGLRVLFDCLDEETVKAIERAEPVKAPLPPKFDQIIYRSNGVMWASECSGDTLAFWLKRASESSDPKYRESDQKKAAALARWIAWREWYPEATWSGERNRDPIVAKPPSSKPTVYPRTGNEQRPAPPPADDGVNADDEIPF